MSLELSRSKSTATIIQLPDILSHCTFDFHINRNHKSISIESNRWMLNGDPELDEGACHAFRGLMAGKLAAMAYSNAGYTQLRVCGDFLNWLFHLDNISDDMDNREIDNVARVVMNSIHHPHTYRSVTRLNRMTQDFYRRIMQTASPGTCRRLQETLEFFFQAIRQQAVDRANGSIPDLESYMALRRDTSGCKCTWVLIEYAYNLNIPDEVMDHPTMRSLAEAATDFVSVSNDIFSYVEERSKGHTHNMIDVVINERGLGLQEAVDVVGEYCKSALDRFVCDRDRLPSWGPAVDADVGAYVDGLADWIVGSLHWSFETERYFGKAGKQIKKSRLVALRPKTAQAAASGKTTS